jgi:DNA-binding response OmpR family regulator
MPKKILIIDNNEFMVEVMTYILISKGYNVTTLYNGDEIFNKVKLDHPDLIILDMLLPGMDGMEICKLLKLNQATKNLPVIICSGNDEVEGYLDEKGAPNDVLYKPFDISSLVEKVELQLAA